MIRALKALVAAACLLAPISASASGENKAPLGWTGARWEKPNRATYQAIDAFARCIVELRLVDVKTLLAFPADSPQINSFALALGETSPGCLNSIALKMSCAVFRGALIEELYRRDFVRRQGGKSTALLGPEAGTTLKLSDCVVAKDLGKPGQLLRTSPASPQQRKVFDKLAPAVQACSAATGQAVPYVQHLRFQIAESLYRLRSGETLATEAAK